jgi:hypothetical protein
MFSSKAIFLHIPVIEKCMDERQAPRYLFRDRDILKELVMGESDRLTRNTP